MKRYKYPRTPHLPWSPGWSSDDVVIEDLSEFADQEVVVTEKMDGENTTLYRDGLHARSLDSGHHSSRSWVKQLQATIGHRIPEGWRVCGENLYARHSVAYDNLPSYFIPFSIWNDENTCLSWRESLQWFKILDLIPPDVFYLGPWDERRIKAIAVDSATSEGYVVCRVSAFGFGEFHRCVAKWVREAHIRSERHWMQSAIVPNGLAKFGGQS